MQRNGKVRASKPAIRKRKRAGAQRRSAPEYSSIRLATIGDIAAVLSHESRNLLGALQTSLQILRRNSHLTGDDRELLDIVESGARRLGEIITDFSTFRRAASLSPSRIDLHGLFEQIVTSLQQDERLSPSILVEKNFDPLIRHIEADHDQLRQVLWHLCLNAAQAMSSGGTLRLETRSAAGEIIIIVRDNGCGISRRIRAKIFEPLFTTKTRGAGLGLTIVREVIARHRGRLDIASKDGAGTTVTIKLPLQAS